MEKLYNKSAQLIVEDFQKVIKLSNRKLQLIFSDPGSKYIIKLFHKIILINFFNFLGNLIIHYSLNFAEKKKLLISFQETQKLKLLMLKELLEH